MNVALENLSSHEIARNLWPSQINACECPDTLTRWYLACRDFSDDLIAQIEAEEVVGLRDDGWKRLVGNYLIGAKKSARLIERVAAQRGFDLPRVRDTKLSRRISELEGQIMQARQFERGVTAEWLIAVHGARGAEIAEELLAKEHFRWRKEVQSQTEGN